ncbi:hypothetical protein Lal_00012143 [Lupinus albus]|nr:hypothetical protein Lal_00012143 [Lupinus albus]
MENHCAQTSLSGVLLDELIFEILSWLPAILLLRFRCVCKSWKSLISDPNFIKLHLQRAPKNANLILILIGNHGERFAISCSCRSLLHHKPSSSTTVIAENLHYRLKLMKHTGIGVSCNGLICLVHAFPKKLRGDEFHKYSVRLWNPVTKLFSKRSAKLLVKVEGRAFDSAEFGLWYDNLTETYKVVAVLVDNGASVENLERTEVRVYEFGDNDDCWRKIQAASRQKMCEWHYNSHYEWDSDTITIDQLVIVSLDLSKERYTQFSLPRGFDEVSLVEPHVTVLMDCLCFSYDYKRTHFVVWQMKEFGVEQSWTRMLLLCLSENGNVLLLSESNKQPQAILYNHKDNRVEHAEISNNINWTVAQDYVQSLVKAWSSKDSMQGLLFEGNWLEQHDVDLVM